jgi:hypothetical protein
VFGSGETFINTSLLEVIGGVLGIKMPTKVYLIGTNHYDLNGEKRLEKLLNLYGPDVIVGEESNLTSAIPEEKRALPFEELVEIFKNKKLGPDLNPETTALFFLAAAFESRVENRYSKEQGIPVIKRITFSGAVEFVENTKKDLVQNGIDSQFPVEYFNLRMTPEGYSRGVDRFYIEHRSALGDTLGINREKDWEEDIRKCEGVVVGIFGSGHVFGQHHNLYDRLSDLNVERILLCDADKI